jgi:hypothetical protein
MFCVMLLCFGKSESCYHSFLKKFILKVSSTMLMEHFLCDDIGGKHNVCGMDYKVLLVNIITNNHYAIKNNYYDYI